MNEKHEQVSTFVQGRRGQILIGEAPTLLQHHPLNTDLGPTLLQALCPPTPSQGASLQTPNGSPSPLLCPPHSPGHQEIHAAVSSNPLQDSPGGT